MEAREQTPRERVIDLLRGYNYLRSRILNIEESIYETRSRLESSSTSSVGASPMHGGSDRYSDKLACGFDRLHNLELDLCVLQADKRMVDRAMENHLSDMEKDVINLFYINRPRDNTHVVKLMRKHYYEKTRIYEIKDEALDKLVKAIIG